LVNLQNRYPSACFFLACICMSVNLRHKHIWPGWIHTAMRIFPYSADVNSFWKQSTSDKQLLFQSCSLWKYFCCEISWDPSHKICRWNVKKKNMNVKFTDFWCGSSDVHV
jgi:hypothetical protein